MHPTLSFRWRNTYGTAKQLVPTLKSSLLKFDLRRGGGGGGGGGGGVDSPQCCYFSPKANWMNP